MALLALCVSPNADAKKQKSRENRLRVLYWNIQNGMWSDQPNNYDNFVEWVKSKDPDICVWCEAATIYYDNVSKSRPKEERYLPSHWGELAARYGHSYWFKSSQRDNYPQVITSKYPIDSIFCQSGNADTVVVHGMGWAKIKVADKDFNFVTLHPKPFAYGYNVKKADRERSATNHDGDFYRLKEVTWVCKHTILTHPNAKNENWIMCGDFNSVSKRDNDKKYKYSTGAPCFVAHDYINTQTPYIDSVAESYPDVFFRSTGGGTRIDYMYVTKPLYDAITELDPAPDKWTKNEKALNENGDQISNFWHPSDHLPILIEFNLSKIK